MTKKIPLTGGTAISSVVQRDVNNAIFTMQITKANQNVAFKNVIKFLFLNFKKIYLKKNSENTLFPGG